MNNIGFISNIDMYSSMHGIMPTGDFYPKSFGSGMNVLNESSGKSFKDVLSGMVSNINNEVNKPDQLLNDYMTGNGEVDIHDVMTAVSKAELGVSMAAQATSKLVSAYSTIMNISI